MGGAEGRGEAERGAGNGLTEAQGNWGAEGGCGVEGEHRYDGESAAGCGVAEIRRGGNGFREARRPLPEPRWGVPPTLWPRRRRRVRGLPRPQTARAAKTRPLGSARRQLDPKAWPRRPRCTLSPAGCAEGRDGGGSVWLLLIGCPTLLAADFQVRLSSTTLGVRSLQSGPADVHSQWRHAHHRQGRGASIMSGL